jgi:putrescine aminotransferase
MSTQPKVPLGALPALQEAAPAASTVVSPTGAVQAFDTVRLRQMDAAHFLHPFTDHSALAARGARVIVRGEGIYVWDSEGHKILDGMSGLWCVNAGYGRTRIVQAAMRQMETLPFYNSFFGTSNVPAIQLATTLSDLAPPRFSRVFYTSSGSEANDTNLRLVRHYWQVLGYPERQVIIGRRNGYHGNTVAGAALGGMGGMHEQGGKLPGIVHVGQPNPLEAPPGMSANEFGLMAAAWVEQAILDVGPDKVAAFIGEPVQGAGGVVIPPETYWPEVQRICEKYGVLVIADEVICGFGRLGTMFGCELMGFRPDLITFAKGVTSGYVPLGGVLVGDRVAEVLIGKGGEFHHGFTYSGHPVACAAALENLAIIEEEQLVHRVAQDTGPYLRQKFASLAEHPLVGHVDSCGFVAGLNLVRRKAERFADCEPFAPAQAIGMLCRGHMFDNGMIMRAVGDRMIIAPPLIMTRVQIDEMVARIGYCLDRTHEDVKARGWLN